ncbi:MAG: transcriptional repressor LexA [Candidatus Dadabacteria bacterium]|nr:MAG: transcriptional repressor LexA [Candidatus Dadabacteria bacterium]
MSPPKLTPKQKRVLEFVRDYWARHGVAPTQQEIARHFGFRSLGTVQNYLKRLEAQGVLHREWNARRSLEVRGESSARAGLELPLLGYVAAGRPIEAVEAPEPFEVPASMGGTGERFVLRVKGDSMVEDGILDGDYVVVEKRETARPGETVVAMVDGEATVKRFHPGRGEIELRPANSAMEPIRVSPDQEFRILGRVVGVIRFCR